MTRVLPELCGQCEERVQPDPLRIGRWRCFSCGLAWVENLDDETTWADELTGVLPMQHAEEL